MFGDISSRPRRVRSLLSVLAVLVALNAYMFARSVWHQRSLANAAVPLMTLAVPPVPPAPPALHPPDIDQRRHVRRHEHIRRHRCRKSTNATAISFGSDSDIDVIVRADYDGALSTLTVDVPDFDFEVDLPVEFGDPGADVDLEGLEFNLDLDEIDEMLEDLRKDIEELSAESI